MLVLNQDAESYTLDLDLMYTFSLWATDTWRNISSLPVFLVPSLIVVVGEEKNEDIVIIRNVISYQVIS